MINFLLEEGDDYLEGDSYYCLDVGELLFRL